MERKYIFFRTRLYVCVWLFRTREHTWLRTDATGSYSASSLVLRVYILHLSGIPGRSFIRALRCSYFPLPVYSSHAIMKRWRRERAVWYQYGKHTCVCHDIFLEIFFFFCVKEDLGNARVRWIYPWPVNMSGLHWNLGNLLWWIIDIYRDEYIRLREDMNNEIVFFAIGYCDSAI